MKQQPRVARHTDNLKRREPVFAIERVVAAHALVRAVGDLGCPVAIRRLIRVLAGVQTARAAVEYGEHALGLNIGAGKCEVH